MGAMNTPLIELTVWWGYKEKVKTPWVVFRMGFRGALEECHLIQTGQTGKGPQS